MVLKLVVDLGAGMANPGLMRGGEVQVKRRVLVPAVPDRLRAARGAAELCGVTFT